jgi:uncharacterized membrane protein
LIVLFGAALRLHGIAREGAWADELWTLLITDPALGSGEFWRQVLADVHPPLYYLLMRGWSAVFGQSDLAARLPSAIAGILTVAAAGAAPLPKAGRLTLMALLAVSPGAIHFAQEARSYALLLLFATILTAVCLRLVSKPSGEPENRWLLTTLTIAGLLAAYTHYFGFLLAIAAGAVVFALRPSRLAAATLAVIGAFFAPWVVYHAQHMASASLAAWIGAFPLDETVDWVLRLWLGEDPTPLALAICAAAAIVTNPLALGAARGQTAFFVGLSLALLTIAAAAIISWRVPILSGRNLIVILPALYLTMAALAADTVRLSAVVGAIGIAGFVAGMMLNLNWDSSVLTKEQWRDSAAFVLAQPGCRRGPILVYGDQRIYRYLVGKARPNLQLIEIPWGGAATAKWQGPTDCSVLLWAGKVSPEDFAKTMSELPRLNPSCRHITEYYRAYVVTWAPDDGMCGAM